LPREIRVEIDDEKVKKLEGLVAALGVNLNELTYILLDITSSYAGELKGWANDLRVKKENKPYSVFEELFFYGLEAWRSLVAKILNKLRARGRFELEALDFDPGEPSIEIEMVALEGSDLKADRLRIYWTLKGVTMEVYYYMEEGLEPPRPQEKSPTDWYYLPDEHAVVLVFRAEDIDGLPPIHAVDRMAEGIGVPI